MMKQASKLLLYIILLAAFGFSLFQPFEATQTPPMTGHGDVRTFQKAFYSWRQQSQQQGGNDRLNLPLRHAKAFSSKWTPAQGRMSLNLISGELTAEIRGLPNNEEFALWLIDHRQDATHAFSATYRVGTFTRENTTARLSTRLQRETLQDFTLDLAVVAPTAGDPEREGLLFGSPGLFQRLFYGSSSWTIAKIGDSFEIPEKNHPLHFQWLLPKPADASVDEQGWSDRSLEELIAQGRKLFTQETFDGNGRTCATCHRPDNNHTIDPLYISKLPKRDPLFVAEYQPALKDLEKPPLLRRFGLILANVDGFEQPGVLRGVPHTLALATSIGTETLADGGQFEEDAQFTNALGWSGDGSPGDGSLRMFAQGAIAQHLTKTLNRVPGADFRLATEAELDAITAYLLSLGRSEDLDLTSLSFTSPLVERGKVLFNSKQNPVDDNNQPIFGQTANCNGCHENAGANSSTTKKNPTRDTGVENMRDHLARLLDPSLPYDGGFGKGEEHRRNNCGPDSNAPCLGDGRFNTPPLIEAADSAPFFHNNSVSTLEEAIAYYNTDAFNHSPGALTSSGKDRQIKLDSSQVVAVALFLRTINALENIRSANRLDEKALAQNGQAAKETIRLAAADTEDAVEVLQDGIILAYPSALADLRKSLRLEQQAASESLKLLRDPLLTKAMWFKNKARALMVKNGG
jgi:cytochrome c553